MPPVPNDERLTIALPGDLLDAARERAEIEERSLGSLIRLAIRRYLANPQ